MDDLVYIGSEESYNSHTFGQEFSELLASALNEHRADGSTKGDQDVILTQDTWNPAASCCRISIVDVIAAYDGNSAALGNDAVQGQEANIVIYSQTEPDQKANLIIVDGSPTTDHNRMLSQVGPLSYNYI